MLFASGGPGDRVQRLSDVNQHAAGGGGIVARRTPEREADRGFDGARPPPVSSPSGARQRQVDPSSIGGVRPAANQTRAFQTREDTGHRCGVKVKRRRKVPGRDAGAAADHQQRKPLRSG